MRVSWLVACGALAMIGCTTDGVVSTASPFDDGTTTLRVYPAGEDCSRVRAGTPEALGDPLDEDTLSGPGAFDLELPSEPLTLVVVYESACGIAVDCRAAMPGQDVTLEFSDLACNAGCTEAVCAGMDAGPVDAGPMDAGPMDAGPVDAGDGAIDDASLDGGCCPSRGTPDADCDDDGLANFLEQLPDGGVLDSDGDGTPDECDTDSDEDGLADEDECRGDVGGCEVTRDGGTGPAYRDPDSDGDGIGDGDECCGWTAEVEGALGRVCDPDGDGFPAHLDEDSDGDGVPDRFEWELAGCSTGCIEDFDTNGVCNLLDPDSDGDGAYDGEECGLGLMPVPDTVADCGAVLDGSQRRCNGSSAGPDFCGLCSPSNAGGCGVGLTCESLARPPYCRTAAGVHADIQVNQGIFVSPIPTPIMGTLELVPIVGSGAPLIFDVAWNMTSPSRVRLANVFARLTRSDRLEGLSCAFPLAYEVPPRCVGVYGIRLQVGGRCSTLPGVLVVSTDRYSLDPLELDVTLPPGFSSSERRQALQTIERGWRYYEPPSAGPNWVPVDEVPIAVTPHPTGFCTDPFQFPDP